MKDKYNVSDEIIKTIETIEKVLDAMEGKEPLHENVSRCEPICDGDCCGVCDCDVEEDCVCGDSCAGTPKKENEIKHEGYYNEYGVECFDIIKKKLDVDGFCDFCLGNVIKYIYRCAIKPNTNPMDDLKKARSYLTILIETIEEELKKEGYM